MGARLMIPTKQQEAIAMLIPDSKTTCNKW